MSTKINLLKRFIKELIKQELDEASTTGAIDGGEGPPKTPYAFSGGRKKDKEKEDKIAKAGGYMKVKESVNEEKYVVYVDKDGKGMRGRKIVTSIFFTVQISQETQQSSDRVLRSVFSFEPGVIF